MAKKQYFQESELVFQKKPADKRFQDLTGMKFNKLSVIGFAGRTIDGSRIWFCKCDCGQISCFRGHFIKRGSTKSCGCHQKNRASESSKTHGHARPRTTTYRKWDSMIYRCYNPICKEYPNYGGRGITVCDRWRNSFENFLADMGECPKGLTIERNEVNGNYEPSNCRWATMKEQQNNKRNSFKIEFKGRIQTVTQWEEELGFKSKTIYQRLVKCGWPIEKAMTLPVKKILT